MHEVGLIKEVFNVDHLLPVPTAIRRMLVVPPVFVFDILTMHPSDPKNIFFVFNNPQELRNASFVSG